MSPKPDPANYDTEDEESILEQSGEQQIFAEILKSLGIVQGINEKSKALDREVLLALVELKNLEIKKEIEKLKSENLDRIDSIFAKLSYSNLPSEVILRLIDNPVYVTESKPEHISPPMRKQHQAPAVPRMSQESSPTRVQTAVQITPPRTQHHQNFNTLHSRKSSQSLPQVTGQRPLPLQTQQQTLAPIPPLNSRHAPNGSMKYYFPTHGIMPGNSQNMQYYPSPFPPQIPEQVPEQIPEHYSMNMAAPQFQYPLRQPQIANTRLGHKRSHSAMTVPEMSTFTVTRGNQPEFPITDSAKASAKVSFLINTPKNPPR